MNQLCSSHVGKCRLRWGTILFALLICLPSDLLAAQWSCAPSAAGFYCLYVGKVKKTYINKDGLIAVYFEEDIPVELRSQIQAYFPGVSQWSGTAFGGSISQETAKKLMFSSALTALAADATVSIFMRGATGIFLQIEHIQVASN